jgi:FixJ family two-component response regulator
MKPLLYYIDDEPHNLVVFEAAMPDTWTVKTFDSAAQALTSIVGDQPLLIVTDQRMPQMNGVQFLELAKSLVPNAVRIIVTGYSDEDLVVESVRRAQIFDYIKKPWDVEDLLKSLNRALEFQRASSESQRLQAELVRREAELRESNESLRSTLKELEMAKRRETDIRQELECWVPPFVLWQIERGGLPQNQTDRRDLVGIAIDIVGSSRLHGRFLPSGKSVRSQVLQVFSECVLRHGGWRESHSGDSAYAHFGLIPGEASPAESAIAAAREFRVALRNLSELSGCEVECGIGLHEIRNCPIHIHTVQLNSPRGLVTQKSFDTSSSDVDLLHRMEKVAHRLPGTNMIMSAGFLSLLKAAPTGRIHQLGPVLLAGQNAPVDLHVLAGDRVTDSHISELREALSQSLNEAPREAPSAVIPIKRAS